MHRRGPDRKPRKLARLTILRALVAAQKRGRKMVPGAGLEDWGGQVILADHGLRNRSHFLRLAELVKEVFDDAEDSGSGRSNGSV